MIALRDSSHQTSLCPLYFPAPLQFGGSYDYFVIIKCRWAECAGVPSWSTEDLECPFHPPISHYGCNHGKPCAELETSQEKNGDPESPDGPVLDIVRLRTKLSNIRLYWDSRGHVFLQHGLPLIRPLQQVSNCVIRRISSETANSKKARHIT